MAILKAKARRIIFPLILALLTFVSLLFFNGCSFKHNLQKSSTNIDTSRSAFHYSDSSLFIDSSKSEKSIEKVVFMDTSQINSVDDYKREQTNYYSKDEITGLQRLDSSKTIKSGKKETTKKNNKNSTTIKKESAAQANVYEAKNKEGDSTIAKGVAQKADKKANTDVGTPFGTYALIFGVIIVVFLIAYRLLRKASPVALIDDTIKKL